MRTPNHIAGGLVFTGTMLSLYNINVFSSPYYMSACVMASLIPDIDTPQTFTGRIFYPIALLLNRKFGHRTFTHSLLFMFFLYLILLFVHRMVGIPNVYVKIFLFGFISHLILDMLTIQGVPLFYPFKRNPCVLPANPSYRFKTSDPKSEIIVFTIFVLLAFTMFPLFSNGFWTSYNRSFATIPHCDRENSNSKNWVACEYAYIKNNREHRGEAIILESNKNRLVLFNHNEVFNLDVEDRTMHIVSSKPKSTNMPKRVYETSFMNISIDSVNNLLSGRVCSGMLQSNFNVKYIDKGITYHTNFIKFSNSYNFSILTTIDTAKLELVQKLDRVNARIIKDSLKQLERQAEYELLYHKKLTLTYKISNTPDSNLYLKNKFQTDLIEISEKLKNFNLKPVQVDIVLKKEKESLVRMLKQERPLLFSGFIVFLIFEEENENGG